MLWRTYCFSAVVMVIGGIFEGNNPLFAVQRASQVTAFIVPVHHLSGYSVVQCDSIGRILQKILVPGSR